MDKKELIIGTTNEGKVKQISGALASLNLQISGLSKSDSLPDILEDGKTAQENAKKKAIIYAQFLGKNVLSMDNSLYFDGLSNESQPGLNVRRIKERINRPTDEELLTYYSQLVKQLGEKINGYWEFAVCIANPTGKIMETTINSPRIFVSSGSTKIIVGYPLDSIQIDPASGRYISEMTQKEQDKFWEKDFGKSLCSFVEKALNSL